MNSGTGYIVSSIDSQVYELSWATTPLTLTDNTSNYVYANPVFSSTGTYGVITSSTSSPVLDEIVYLGRVFTYSGSINYMASSVIDMNQYGDSVEAFQRQALGSIYVSGSTVSEDATPFNLDITAGSYYYGTVNYLPSGGILLH